jgi:hypothetical protein
MRAAIMFALMTTVAHGQLLLERNPATLPFEVTLRSCHSLFNLSL